MSARRERLRAIVDGGPTRLNRRRLDECPTPHLNSVSPMPLPKIKTNSEAPPSDLPRDRAHLIHSLHSAVEQDQARVWVRGEGPLLWDESGKEFLDALAGLWNVVVGHGRRELAGVAARQMETLAYTSSYSGGTNRPSIELGERLAQLCYPNIQKFYFTSGGAEANEAAFKTARYYWRTRGKPDKWRVIARTWGYHGTTLATMSATGMSAYWTMFEPRTPGFLHIESPYPYRFSAPGGRDPNDSRSLGQIAADLLEEAILREGADQIAAFIGEPVQGAGGVIVPPDDYWPRIRQICDRHQVLLIADEVITGFGRTGDWFGLSKYGIEPDIVTFAKAITSGYFPLGGMGVRREIADAIEQADESSKWMQAYTYSGHPTACAVALANLAIIEREGLIARAADLGRQLLTKLQALIDHPHVGDVRGQGLMCAVEFVVDRATKAPFAADKKIGALVHNATQRRGMFTRLRGDVFNLAPCYVTDPRQIDQMVRILSDSIVEVLGA